MWAVKKLRVYLYGIPCEAFTDHQPLLSFISMGEKKPRVQRMCDFLSSYVFHLTHPRYLVYGVAMILNYDIRRLNEIHK